MDVSSKEQIYSAIDGIFIDAIDNGFSVEIQYYCSKKDGCFIQVHIDYNKKDFKIQRVKDYSLTLTDYLDAIGEYKVRFITLNKASQKEVFTKFPIFNFKEIRRFKILIEKK
jgi:hypothetical protein